MEKQNLYRPDSGLENDQNNQNISSATEANKKGGQGGYDDEEEKTQWKQNDDDMHSERDLDNVDVEKAQQTQSLGENSKSI